MHPYLYTIDLNFLGWDKQFPIRSFSVMVLLGVLCGAWWLNRALARQGVRGEGVLDHLVRNALVFGFLGARWLYLIVHPEAYKDPISLIALWEGGLVSYGGFVGGALGAWLFARKRGIPMARLGDALLPALAFGQIFGRMGCLLVGDDHGSAWDGPWAITFPDVEGSLMPPELIGVPVHPAQIYLSLMNATIFAITATIYARRTFDGQVLGVGMILYAIGRSAIEMTRGDDAARGIYFGLSTAQWISVAVALAALALLLKNRGRPATSGQREMPEPQGA